MRMELRSETMLAAPCDRLSGSAGPTHAHDRKVIEVGLEAFFRQQRAAEVLHVVAVEDGLLAADAANEVMMGLGAYPLIGCICPGPRQFCHELQVARRPKGAIYGRDIDERVRT